MSSEEPIETSTASSDSASIDSTHTIELQPQDRKRASSSSSADFEFLSHIGALQDVRAVGETQFASETERQQQGANHTPYEQVPHTRSRSFTLALAPNQGDNNNNNNTSNNNLLNNNNPMSSTQGQGEANTLRHRVLVGVGVVVGLFLVIGLPLIFSSNETVDFDEVAVLINNNGNVDRAVGPGRYFVGPAGRAIKFPRFDRTIEYTEDANTAISVRVRDGQIIELDLSFQYHIPREHLVDIYRIHKQNFEPTLRGLARGILRDVAASHPSEMFFRNRTQLESEMRLRMQQEGNERLIEITGFQLRKIILPDELNNRLIDVELARQDARERQEQLILDRINAEAAATQLRLSTSRRRFITEYEQATRVLVVQEEQQRRRVEQRTNQLVTQLQEESRRNVSLYTRQTEIKEEAFALDTSVEEEETRRQVERVRYESETNLTVYHQDTENLKLQYDEEIALLNEQTRQNVTSIHADTEREVTTFLLALDLSLEEAQGTAQVLRAKVREEAAKGAADALADGLAGLPSAAYLAETYANGTMPHVRYMDENFGNLLGMALGEVAFANASQSASPTSP